MSDGALVDLVVPVISFSAALSWLMAVRLALPYLREGASLPEDVRLPVVAALVIVAVLMALSSLAYPDLIPGDWSRFLLLVCRTVLLVTGAMTWWELRTDGGDRG